MKFWAYLMILCLGLFNFSCRPVEYSLRSENVESSLNDTLEKSPPESICDPFEPGNNISRVSGLAGNISYLRQGDPRQSTSEGLLQIGQKVTAEIFLSSIFIPTRTFQTGFQSSSDSVLKNNAGEDLTEWFALDLRSHLVLALNQPAGKYQLALISDDGSTLSVAQPDGVYSKLIQNENQHATRMACAIQTVTMTPNTRLPIRLTYFQGPRDHIALMLVWRKVNGPEVLNETECGKEGGDYFFSVGTSTTPAQPKAPYRNLISRGWTPLVPENFELQSGSNRCAP